MKTTKDVSQELGISSQLVNYWARRTGVRMFKLVKRGQKKVFKFSESDIEIIKLKAKAMKTKAQIVQELLDKKAITAEEAVTLLMDNDRVQYIPQPYPVYPNPLYPVWSTHWQPTVYSTSTEPLKP